MAKVAVLIDGFNVYHAIDDRPDLHRFKWLDYRSLAEKFVIGNDELVRVLWFTAYLYYKPEKAHKHQRLVKANQSRDVEVVFGLFRRKSRYVPQIGQKIWMPEEKRTDVNIAVRLLEMAYDDVYEKAIIVTGDSDMVPAIEAVRARYPEKRIGIVTPIGRRAECCQRRGRLLHKNDTKTSGRKSAASPSPARRW